MKRYFTLLNFFILISLLLIVKVNALSPPLSDLNSKVDVLIQEIYDDNRNYVYELIPNENINLSLSVSSQEQISTIFAAVLYDEQNKVKDIKTIKKPLIQSNIDWVNFNMQMPNDTRGCYIKIICLDLSNLNPLIDPIKFGNTASRVEVVPRIVKNSLDWELKMTIINYTKEDVTIEHPSDQIYDFTLLDSSKNEIYKWSDGKHFLTVVTTTKIGAGQKVEYTERLSNEDYQAIFDKAFYMKAYIMGESNNFIVNPNGYEIMVDDVRVMKPNIYLYPQQQQNISVKVNPNGYITKSIPYYKDGWNYSVAPDGLIDGKYGFLFYEAILNSSFTLDKGWLLDKNSFDSSMDNILTCIGLNDTEKKDFLDYWTNILEWQKQYYAVYYVSPEEIDKNIPLTIDPKPDSLLRTFFFFVATDDKIEIQEPTIQTFVRNGFSAVEWGGMVKN